MRASRKIGVRRTQILYVLLDFLDNEAGTNAIRGTGGVAVRAANVADNPEVRGIANIRATQPPEIRFSAFIYAFHSALFSLEKRELGISKINIFITLIRPEHFSLGRQPKFIRRFVCFVADFLNDFTFLNDGNQIAGKVA